MGWGAIRVWNDDKIAAGTGFPPHPHADMEIITYVREGAITHQDSLGNSGRTEAGDVQVMSAGTGIRHAEYNLEPGATTHLPDLDRARTTRGGAPSWGAKPFPKGDRSGKFVTLASGFAGDADALPIRTDARVARRDAQGRRDGRICARRRPPRLSGAGDRRGRGQRRARSTPATARRSRDEAVLRVTALEDAEIVLVDAA